ncbi:diphthine--ammonia ligase [Robertkochia solimangrovi]|uniref:Dph6-related ATP pyrophosphatase n=1 Tax=Robertkochia solimangrovi TaxID=2213046 RepID=UPI0011808E19|nr:diphthine--ammonia ligase [Robertkochia solimangrovi]TRZ45163.1 diphthine--ammonia ligase [Robertkochia solimangrovi]
MSVKRTYFNWSSGKDSAMALYKILNDPDYEVGTLVTTLNDESDRVSMHGLRKELLFRQVKSLGIPLHEILLPGIVSMEQYNSIMSHHMEMLKDEGYTHTVFGDIFLEDLKKYREDRLAEFGINAVFPLWKIDTRALMKEFLELGFKAIIVCVNAKYLGKEFAGKLLSEELLNEFPENVDPCGENGEFHTFVFDGPIFKEPISFSVGEVVERQYTPAKKKEDNCFKEEDEPEWDNHFYFCDLIPDNL